MDGRAGGRRGMYLRMKTFFIWVGEVVVVGGGLGDVRRRGGVKLGGGIN